jgi:hypothetical protein
MLNKLIVVNDSMQSDYQYYLTAEEGDLPSNFRPNVTPMQALELGIFGGLYMRDCVDEFPNWFAKAKLCTGTRNNKLNHFGVDASQPLATWKANGWITPDDPRGWFQWYCRFYMGRRTTTDTHQINRWRQMSRHLGQIIANCNIGDIACRPRQRQALLHWAVLVDGSQTSPSELRAIFK